MITGKVVEAVTLLIEGCELLPPALMAEPPAAASRLFARAAQRLRAAADVLDEASHLAVLKTAERVLKETGRLPEEARIV